VKGAITREELHGDEGILMKGTIVASEASKTAGEGTGSEKGG
jgi:hypothetical protein